MNFNANKRLPGIIAPLALSRTSSREGLMLESTLAPSSLALTRTEICSPSERFASSLVSCVYLVISLGTTLNRGLRLPSLKKGVK